MFFTVFQLILSNFGCEMSKIFCRVFRIIYFNFGFVWDDFGHVESFTWSGFKSNDFLHFSTCKDGVENLAHLEESSRLARRSVKRKRLPKNWNEKNETFSFVSNTYCLEMCVRGMCVWYVYVCVCVRVYVCMYLCVFVRDRSSVNFINFLWETPLPCQ